MGIRHLTNHRKWVLAALLLALFVALCALPVRTSSNAFQTRLSHLDIAFQILRDSKAILLDIPSLEIFWRVFERY